MYIDDNQQLEVPLSKHDKKDNYLNEKEQLEKHFDDVVEELLELGIIDANELKMFTRNDVKMNSQLFNKIIKLCGGKDDLHWKFIDERLCKPKRIKVKRQS